MKKLLTLSLAYLLFINSVNSQGCIAVRNISGFGQYNLTDNAFSTSNWQLNITNRYFKSFREFKGTEEQKSPEQDRIIHHIYTMDMQVTRFMSKGWSLSIGVPFSSNSRSTS